MLFVNACMRLIIIFSGGDFCVPPVAFFNFLWYNMGTL